MKLFMFQFADRPYGGRFIAVIHNTREEALELAIQLTGETSDTRLRQFWKWADCGVGNGIADAGIGAWVDGSHEE